MSDQPSISSKPFFRTREGRIARLFVLEIPGRAVSLCDRGASLVSYRLGLEGDGAELIFRYGCAEQYEENPLYLGSTIGRHAGRISGAAFELEGTRYVLDANDGPNCLHGGPTGLHALDWEAEPFHEAGAAGVRFTTVSRDGSGGFPGTLQLLAEYRLCENGELSFHSEARTDRPTPVSITNHAYWNLGGGSDIRAHRARLFSSRRLELGPDRVPTGRVLRVEGERHDLRAPLDATSRDGFRLEGFDDYYLAERNGIARTQTSTIADFLDPGSGRRLEVASNAPGFVFYSGDFAGCAGFCVEPSEFPDAPNRPEFPSSLIMPGTARVLDIVWRIRS
ncbi:MAG: galactose mutarotase [Spirochaetales bacterium]|nr:galactose mutarotase [Spirochaetales bacterium]